MIARWQIAGLILLTPFASAAIELQLDQQTNLAAGIPPIQLSGLLPTTTVSASGTSAETSIVEAQRSISDPLQVQCSYEPWNVQTVLVSSSGLEARSRLELTWLLQDGGLTVDANSLPGDHGATIPLACTSPTPMRLAAQRVRAGAEVVVDLVFSHPSDAVAMHYRYAIDVVQAPGE